MNIPGVYQREKRNPSQMYHPMHSSIAYYCNEAFQKREMKHNFNDDLFLNNIHLIPDPLKKNLADSLFNTDNVKNPEKMGRRDQNLAMEGQEAPLEKPPKQTTALGGIGGFFYGVMNALTSVMFRSRSTNYYDCFDVDSQGKAWQHARTDVQDKNGQAGDRNSYDGAPNQTVSSEMNFDSRDAVSGCERKLNQVLHLLAPKQTSSPVWVRKRPKKVFVEPGSVEESFEDAFSPEDFVSLSNDSYIEYYSPLQWHSDELYETAAQKTKLNLAPVNENMSIIKDVTNKNDLEVKKKDVQLENDNVQEEKNNMQLVQQKVQLDHENVQTDQQKMQLEQQNVMTEKSCLNTKQQLENEPLEMDKTELETPNMKDLLVLSCEDKLSRLKALLQDKRMKCRSKCEVPESSQDLEVTRTTPPKMVPKETKTADKHFKNPNRRCSKRFKSKLKCRIEDDLVFANEMSFGTPPSAENSPMQHNVNFGDYFDEISGRFRTMSTGSDDSFQIVFNDYQTGRLRKSSDCDSEDSFIVFEDSPESCYVSNDVFDSDSESDISDSGCGVTCRLAHTLTRTVSNLADDSLYVSEDEVDFGMDTTETTDVLEEESTGLLLDEKKKQLRKCQPSKKVHFSTDPPKVHVMRVWAFAARQARAGHWERYAVDRERFKRRIADMEMALSWVLKPQHRRRVMFQRFMPWWNQLKRKELAEKKEKEAEEKRREEERQKEEQETQVEIKELVKYNEEVEETSREDEKQTGEQERQVGDTELAENDKEINKRRDVRQENKSLETKSGEDLNMNENEESCKEINDTTLNYGEFKNNTEKKDLKVKETGFQKKLQDSRVAFNEDIELEFSNNSLNENSNGKIPSNLILQDEFANKIEVSDKNRNIEIVKS